MIDEINELLDKRDRAIACLLREVKELRAKNAELHSLLQKSQTCREQYVLRWILSMKTPEDRVDPLGKHV